MGGSDALPSYLGVSFWDLGFALLFTPEQPERCKSQIALEDCAGVTGPGGSRRRPTEPPRALVTATILRIVLPALGVMKPWDEPPKPKP